MRPFLAHCHLGLGTLAERAGRLEQARGEAVTAQDAYRALDMPFWLAAAQQALVRLGHPQEG